MTSTYAHTGGCGVNGWYGECERSETDGWAGMQLTFQTHGEHCRTQITTVRMILGNKYVGGAEFRKLGAKTTERRWPRDMPPSRRQVSPHS